MKAEALISYGLSQEEAGEIIKQIQAEYVTKAKYEQLEEKLTDSTKLVSEIGKELDGLKKNGDPLKLSEELESTKAQIAALQAEHEKQLEAKDLDYAIKTSLLDAHDPDIVAGLVDRERLKIVKDGGVSGLDEQLLALRKEKAFLFKQESNDGAESHVFSGITPKDGSGQPAAGANPWSKESFSMEQQAAVFRENPAKARQLAAAAGVQIPVI